MSILYQSIVNATPLDLFWLYCKSPIKRLSKEVQELHLWKCRTFQWLGICTHLTKPLVKLGYWHNGISVLDLIKFLLKIDNIEHCFVVLSKKNNNKNKTTNSYYRKNKFNANIICRLRINFLALQGKHRTFYVTSRQCAK